MDTTRITRGDDLMLFNSNKEAIAFATNHTLTLTGDAIEISCKDSGIWKDSIVNKLGWEISSENLYCDAEYEKIFDLWVKRAPIPVYFGKRNGTGGGGPIGIADPHTWVWLEDFPPTEGAQAWVCDDGKTFYVDGYGCFDKYGTNVDPGNTGIPEGCDLSTKPGGSGKPEGITVVNSSSPDRGGSGSGATVSNLFLGKAVITNLSINAASGDNATYSITLQGVGEFSKVK